MFPSDDTSGAPRAGEDDIGHPRDIARPLVFMHIPKCAGTAIDKCLRDGAPSDRQFNLLGPTLYGDFDDYDSFGPEVRGWIHEAGNDCPQDIDYVAGHAGARWFDRAYPNGQKITFLREPKMRILSHWLYWRTFSEAERSYWGTYSPRLDLAMSDLETFIGAPQLASQVDNVFVRMLLYPHPLVPGGDFISPEHDATLAAEAIAAIDRFGFVGLVEDRDLIPKLQAWLGRPLTLTAENVARPMPEALRHPLRDALTRRAWSRLESGSRLDQVIWDHVAKKGAKADPRAMQTAAIAYSVARFADIMR